MVDDQKHSFLAIKVFLTSTMRPQHMLCTVKKVSG